MIGPVPYITRKRMVKGHELVTFVPDYTKSGVIERVKQEVDLIEDACWIKGKN